MGAGKWERAYCFYYFFTNPYQAGSASSEDSGDHLLQACWQTMQTGFILAIRATKAIGATMATLEIMLTMASPLAVEPTVFLQAQVSLLVFQVEEVDRTIYHWTAPKSLQKKKAMEKPQCQLTMPKLLALTKIVSLTVRFLSES